MSQIKIDGYNFKLPGDTKKRNGPIGLAKIQGAYGEPPKMNSQSYQEDDASGETMPGFNLLSDQEQRFSLKETTRIMQQNHGNKQEVGSTLTSLVAWTDPEKKQLHGVTCNVGDSLTFFVIIGADGKVRFEKQLNRLHENPDREKIKIGVSRSIGDKEEEKNGLTHEPDITREVIQLEEGDRVFAIAASDGLCTGNKHFQTPALTSTDIANTLSEFIAKNPDCGPDDIAEALISKGFAGGKGSTDNTVVIVAEVGEEPISILAADGHGGVTPLGEKGADVSKAIAENFHSQLQTQMKLVKPQAYIDALREGNYKVAVNLARLLYDKYVPLNDGKDLTVEETLPLMTSLLAETDIAFEDIANIYRGELSFDSDEEAEQRYYMSQMGTAALTLLANEATLREQDGNQDKEVRQIIRDGINKAIEGPHQEKNATLEVKTTITSVQKNQDMEDLVKKEMTPQRAFAYAVAHLIKENVDQIRVAGEILTEYLDNEVDIINRNVSILNKEVSTLEEEIKAIREEQKELEKPTVESSQEEFLAKKKELDERLKLKINRRLEVLKLIREAKSPKEMIEAELALLCTKPEEFKNEKILDNHLMDFFKKMMRETSVNEFLTSLPHENDLKNVQDQIKTYLDILDKNPVENPDENPKLLKSYNARKDAAENMLIIINTSSLRSGQETLAHLKKNIKAIEDNRPGLLELGIVGWVKGWIEKLRTLGTKTNDPLKSAKTGLEELKPNFVRAKQQLEGIKKEHAQNEPKADTQSQYDLKL
ncbi:hypothetical protein HBNCFIEN_01111 [Legionella sp. PC997]|nr:hypothetical protein HBNCFIEN_01111 [Legionella sp. PC997]